MSGERKREGTASSGETERLGDLHVYFHVVVQRSALSASTIDACTIQAFDESEVVNH